MTGKMSQTRLRAWWTLATWSVAGVVFGVIFFGWGGPGAFGSEKWRVLATAIPIAFGYLGLVVVLWLTRSRDGAVMSDERDAQVNVRASQATLTVLLMAVYALAIGMWEVYREAGVVPIGWLWLIAYGAMITTFVVHSVATLVIDSRYGGHG